MNYLLDTHTLIWFVDGDKRLPKEQSSLIVDPGNVVLVSHASIWEIIIKSSIGKLDFSLSPEDLELFLRSKNFELLPTRFAHFRALLHLPFHHTDPFDRMLIAQAASENFTIITCDPKFQLYEVHIEFY